MAITHEADGNHAMNRRHFLQTALQAAAASGFDGWFLGAAEFEFEPDENIVPAPRDPALWPTFRERLLRWREETRRRLNYDDSLYRKPEFAWSASNYSCLFLMIYDEAFYDTKSGRYTVEPLLDEGLREFGGYDSLVLWHAYPRIGVDQRNQFDFYRDMPGGLEGVREAVHRCQQRGVRVYIDYNPWDTGTRREEKPDLEMLAEIVGALDADGIFLDTMARGAGDLRTRLDAVRPGVILEGEGVPPLENICDHHASWAQGFNDSEAPGVLRHKWIERRHTQHQIWRWRFDHAAELHTAWMNGSGMMVWENVFGAWVGWNARDRSLLRAMLPIQRRYPSLFSGEGWTPLVPVETSGVYASLWTDGELRLWTLVNRKNAPVEGGLLKIEPRGGDRCFDLVAGRELKLAGAVLQGAIAGRGLGCFLAAPTARLGRDFEKFLAAQAATHARAEVDVTHPRRSTRLVEVAPTSRVKVPPAGMVAVRPGDGGTLFVQMRMRECGFYDSNTDDEDGYWYSYSFQTRNFERRVELRAFAMDETPVTNAQFAAFLKATGYHPEHPENFLKHWTGNQPPHGKADHPVVWVDLGDARAYAAWAGNRLPTEEEWQYAAQGGDGREYPWGNGLCAGVCNLGETGDTTPVKAFPAGRSPAGIYDLCGNVWQWTESERTDGRSRFCIIRGGSYFAAKGSQWYVDGGPRPASYATKFLLMWPGLDRCATIGFRCVKDLE